MSAVLEDPIALIALLVPGRVHLKIGSDQRPPFARDPPHCISFRDGPIELRLSAMAPHNRRQRLSVAGR